MAASQVVLTTSTRRVLVITSLIVLLLTAPGLYMAYASYSYGVNVPHIPVPSSGVTSGHGLVEVYGSHTSSGDGQHNTSIVEDSEQDRDAFTLHPNEHTFRKPQTIRMSWNVSVEEIAPDGVMKKVYMINGQFPGPTIEARSGDELVINVHNSIQHSENGGISIHWHGLSMKGANHMDGVVGLTQCAIGPSESFIYRFRINESQSGTFWYHAHAGLQRADGLFGGLVVHKPADLAGLKSDLSTYQYEAEKLLLVGDWYHRQAGAVFDWYQDPGHYAKEPAPDSLLINGKGWFNCSMAVKAQLVLCQTVARPPVRLPNGERVRLRVVNVGVSSGFTLSISQGAMKLITVDGGGPVGDTPVATVMGVLYPGERMDLVLDRSLQDMTQEHIESRDSEEETKLTIALDRENMKFENYALTRIQSFPLLWKGVTASHSRLVRHKASPASSFLLSEASGLPAMIGFDTSEKPIETSVLYTTMQIRSSFHNRPVGIVNHTSWMVADSKGKPLLALDFKDWAKATKQPSSIQTLDVPWYRHSGADRSVELVLNNMDDTGHPFHLHGYEFYILSIQTAAQSGGYNPFDPAATEQAGPKNLKNPLRKDTVYVPPRGYAVLRFSLGNDGLWLLHCHVLLHQAAGMGMVFRVGDIDRGARRGASELCTK